MLEFESLAAIALRVSVMYLYALAILRLSGKRSVGQLAGPDVVATIVEGDMFDDIFWGEVSLAKGLVGATTIVALHLLTKVWEAHSSRAKAVFDGEPALVVLNGAFAKAGQERERVRDDIVREMLRLRGVEDLSAVREARLEVDGALSVLRFEERKPAQKSQHDALRKVAA